MKKIIFPLLAVAFILSSCAAARQAKANKDTNQYRYEIECAGNAIQDRRRRRRLERDRLLQARPHIRGYARQTEMNSVIFKGYGGGQGCVSQRPLAAQPGIETQYKDYFDSFFANGGEFQKYASIMSGTTETVRVGNEYKVGVVVSVRKDDLRKALEAAGILKKLNSGF